MTWKEDSVESACKITPTEFSTLIKMRPLFGSILMSCVYPP